ncbi:hypothetical protein [Vibrio ichthyoenteri]|nr:hypothetical protein [Vibrio ichthyoenteri]
MVLLGGHLFFSFVFLKLNGYAASNSLFLFSGGMISLILLLDDCFMLHEVIYPEWLGIPEKAVMASYALILLAYLFQFRRKILSSDVTLLLVFFTTFGFSAVVDNLLPISLLSLHFLLEDGAKFIGIMSWFGYQSLVCFTELKLTIVK